MLFSRSSNRPTARPARPARWAALLAASILLHLFAFDFAGMHLDFADLPEDKQVVVTAALVPPAPARAAAPKPSPRKKPAAAAAAPMTEPIPMSQEAPEPETVAAAPATSTEPVAATEPEPVAEQPPASPYAISLPPSAQLDFDVRAKRGGQNWYGTGSFLWENGGDHYSITGEASVSLIFSLTLLNFKSEGMVNGFGIAPVLYSEKPRRKALTNTHFQHDNKLISFSASTATYPYAGGEQDRASIIWQLAGIGRGAPQQFAPGAALDIVVAGTRRAENWRLVVIGEEEVATPYGNLRAWRVERTPRPGSYDEKIDIWFAPQLDWYPVRLLYTYTTGDHLDLSLKKLNR